jgi:hypothetical protein
VPKEVWWGRAEIEAADPVFDIMRRLIDNYPDNEPLMPLVVLQPDGDGGPELDERATQIVDFVHQAHRPRRLMAKRLEGGGGEDAYESAIAMLRELSEHGWENQNHSQYKPFVFPRSRLLRAIEQAAPEVGGGQGTSGWTAAQRRERLIRRLAELRWRPGQDYDDPGERRGSGVLDAVGSVVNPEGFVGALFIALLSVLLSEEGWHWQPAVWGGLAALAGFGLVQVLARKAPPLLWLRRASRWFATTTFLAASSDRPQAAGWSRWQPSKSWETIEGRAFAVAQQVVAAQAGDPTARQFHLELRVLALLEDVRHNFRPHTVDMRRRKRTVPPVVYLPRATEANGGMLLLRAISNVRSRRSEMDPLLALAAMPAAETLRPPGSGEPPEPPAGRPGSSPRTSGPDTRYREWVTNLSVGQSPSRAAALPWILWLPLPVGQLLGSHSVQHSTTRIRRTAAWLLWSRPCLAVVLAIALALGFLGNQVLANRYCEGQLIASNTDAGYVGSGADRECIGVATGDYRFAAGNRQKLAGAGDGITFEEVELAVRGLNARIGSDDYVTIVYAGELTTDDPDSIPKGLEELTGVYLDQYDNNIATKDPVKIKILLANGGRHMLHASEMARHIARLAQRDRTVVGVVGLGRDVTDSGEAVGILQHAGLPVVDTTNSGAYLARTYPNYFGLAATDVEQAQVLGLVARHVAEQREDSQAVVLSRRTDPGDKDQYTLEQAREGEAMLGRAGFHVQAGEKYTIESGDAADIGGPVDDICQRSPVPTALYFAGRVEDVSPLMKRLSSATGCSKAGITVFTGDDVSKGVNDEGNAFAENITLYYTSLAPMDLAGKPLFYAKARRYLKQIVSARTLPESAPSRLTYKDGLFVSGQVVLAYSATEALYHAATFQNNKADKKAKAWARKTGIWARAAETWANMPSVEMQSMPTGTVTFQDTEPYSDQKVHGIEVIRLTYPNGRRAAEFVCGRPAGHDQTLRNPTCPLK